jgi:hypothetical protein
MGSPSNGKSGVLINPSPVTRQVDRDRSVAAVLELGDQEIPAPGPVEAAVNENEAQPSPSLLAPASTSTMTA